LSGGAYGGLSLFYGSEVTKLNVYSTPTPPFNLLHFDCVCTASDDPHAGGEGGVCREEFLGGVVIKFTRDWRGPCLFPPSDQLPSPSWQGSRSLGRGPEARSYNYASDRNAGYCIYSIVSFSCALSLLH
jgi:hypothetical protein